MNVALNLILTCAMDISMLVYILIGHFSDETESVWSKTIKKIGETKCFRNFAKKILVRNHANS